MEEHSMSDASLSPLLTTLRAEVQRSRQARHVERRLRHELEQFTSPADQLELSAVLRRHAPERAAQVRDLLRG
jgi:hypothetical protein